MELMDRALQLEMLHAMARAYPRALLAHDFGVAQDDAKAVFNLAYLHEHGLARVNLAGAMSGTKLLADACATARGLDFLQDDGGLTAMLNVTTIRLDAETVRALIEEKVEAAAIPEDEKHRLINWLKTARAEALQEATSRLVGAALDQAPAAIRLLQTLLG